MNTKTKILALWGKGECGKTTSLLLLKDLLLANGGTLVSRGSCKTPGDEWFIIRYNNKTIGITTQGDAADLLNDDFPHFTNCDIIICATRSKGGTVKYIETNFHKDNIYWLSKTTLNIGSYTAASKASLSNTYSMLNQQQAEEMLTIIDSVLIGGASIAASTTSNTGGQQR